jgi:inner membrane protein
MITFSGKIHWGFALIIWCLIQVGVEDVFLNPIPFLIGSVFPDCDHRRAPMGRLLPLWIVFNHRGFTHTLPSMVIFSAIVAYVSDSWMWCIMFAGGYLLHLMMDSGTPMGIKWLRGHRKRAYR